MYWEGNESPVESRNPHSAADAIDLLEEALSIISNGWLEADRLNTEPAHAKEHRRGENLTQMIFHIPNPPPPEQRRDGVVHAKWEKKTLCISGAPVFNGVKPQTIYWKTSEAPWAPMFHGQVRSDIFAAVQFLAPICEEAGWSADPLDRLIAWSVQVSPYRDEAILQAVHLLIAKLRRRISSINPISDAEVQALAYKLNESDWKIILRSSAAKMLLPGPDLYTDVTERTGKDSIRKLEELKILQRPSKQGGYGLTELGIRLAKLRS